MLTRVPTCPGAEEQPNRLPAPPTNAKTLPLVRRILDYGIAGVGPLSSAAGLAAEYQRDNTYADDDARVDALIRWEATKNFTSGFLTGLGGLLTLPLTIPSALSASWIIQARLCGAIAVIYGYDVRSDRVRTLVLLALLGGEGKEVLKQAGVALGRKAVAAAIERVPGKLLLEINKKVGFRLLTKAGERGLVNLTKVVPVVSGVIGGAFDATACVLVGKVAKRIFRPHPGIRPRRATAPS